MIINFMKLPIIRDIFRLITAFSFLHYAPTGDEEYDEVLLMWGYPANVPLSWKEAWAIAHFFHYHIDEPWDSPLAPWVKKWQP